MVGTIGVLCRLLKLLRDSFAEVPLYLRADSSFALPEFLDFLETEALRYTPTMGANRVLEALSRGAMNEARRQVAEQQATATVYGEVRYQSGGGRHARTIAYKAQVLVHPDKEVPRDNARYLIHNPDSRYGPHGAFDFYYGHSDMENAIKELKNDLAMNRTICSQFTANQLRLLLTLTTCGLLQSVAERTSDLDLLKAPMTTLRARLLKIPVRVRSSVRRITLEFTSHHPWADGWLRTARSLGAVPSG